MKKRYFKQQSKWIDEFNKDETTLVVGIRKRDHWHNPVTLTVIGPAYFPNTDYCRYFRDSAAKYAVKPVLYGVGKAFGDWMQTHVNDCIDVVSSIRTSHVLFTDTRDVICLASMREIINKYVQNMYEPRFLCAVEAIDGRLALNFGGWMADRTSALFVLKQLRDCYSQYGGDPQERMRAFSRDNKLYIHPDYQRQIFQCVDGSSLSVKDGRVYNSDTGAWPCLWHCQGGYSHPIAGKEDRMEPTWKELGYA